MPSKNPKSPSFFTDTLRSYFTDNYRSVRCQSLETFWDDIVEDRSILRMMREMIEEDSRLVNEREHIRRLRARERRRLNIGTRGEQKEGGVNSEENKEGGDNTKTGGEKKEEVVTIEASDKGEGGAVQEASGNKEDVKQEDIDVSIESSGNKDGSNREETDSELKVADAKEEVAVIKQGESKEGGDKVGGGEISRVVKSPVLEPSEDTSSSLVTNDLEFLSDEDEVEDGQTAGKRMRLRIRPEDRALFALGRGLGCRESVGQRVLQIATVLRNFTFNEENNTLLSRDLTFLR